MTDGQDIRRRHFAVLLAQGEREKLSLLIGGIDQLDIVVLLSDLLQYLLVQTAVHADDLGALRHLDDLEAQAERRIDHRLLGDELQVQGEGIDLFQFLGRLFQLTGLLFGHLGNVLEGEHDLVAGRALLLGGDRDLADALRGGCHRLHDQVKLPHDLLRHLVGAGGHLGPLFNGHDGGVDRVLELLDDGPGRLRVLARDLGQPAHFGGNDPETLAELAGGHRLDCGIKGEEVGLVGDIEDDLQYFADLLALGAEHFGLLRDLVHLLVDLFNMLDHIADQGRPFARGLVGIIGEPGHLVGVLCDLGGGAGQLLHGGGDLGDTAGLLGTAAGLDAARFHQGKGRAHQVDRDPLVLHGGHFDLLGSLAQVGEHGFLFRLAGGAGVGDRHRPYEVAVPDTGDRLVESRYVDRQGIRLALECPDQQGLGVHRLLQLGEAADEQNPD